MQRFDVEHRIVTLGTEHIGCAIEQLPLPIDDLIRMHTMLLGQLGQCLFAANRIQGHLGLEGR